MSELTDAMDCPWAIDEVDFQALRAQVDAAVADADCAAAWTALQLAWQGRQRDTRDALELAAAAERMWPGAPEPGFRARAALVRAEAAWLFSEPAHARSELVDARRHFGEANDPIGLSDCAWLQAQMAGDEGRAAQQDSALQEALEQARHAGDRQREVHVRLHIAFQAAVRDPVAAAAPWRAEVAQALADGVALWQPTGQMFFGYIAFQANDYAEAIRRSQAAASAAEQLGLGRQALTSALTVAAAFANLHDKHQSLDWAERALELARRAGWPASIGSCLMSVGATLRELGRLDAAAEVLDEAITALGAMAGSRNEALAINYRGTVDLDCGQPCAALARFEAVAQRAGALGLAELAGYADEGRARALLALQQPREALRFAQAALQAAEAQGASDAQVDALMIIADIHAAEGGAEAHHRALAVLEDAQTRARSASLSALAPELHERLARSAAALGLHEQAYRHVCDAMAGKQRLQNERATQHLLALEVRMDTERVRAEAARQRERAAAEAERARLLGEAHDTLEQIALAGQDITRGLDAPAIAAALERHVRRMLIASEVEVRLGPALSDEGLPLADAASGHDEPPVLATLRQQLLSGGSELAECPHPTQAQHDSAAALGPPEAPHAVLLVRALSGASAPEREHVVLRSLQAFGSTALGHALAYRQLLQAHARLAKASVTDPLTGMHNRRYLMQQIDADVDWVLRQNSVLGGSADLVFLLADLDHFKQLNDRLGHDAGDRVLGAMRDRLRPQLRTGDYLVRWGGEEFLVVARGGRRADAAALADRLRRAVAEAPFSIGPDQSAAVTVSIGWAAFPWWPARPRELSWQEVVRHADRALYRAKSSGRNTCCGALAAETSAGVEYLLAPQPAPEGDR